MKIKLTAQIIISIKIFELGDYKLSNLCFYNSYLKIESNTTLLSEDDPQIARM